MEINIAHLYPDLLNLYGDRGNIITLKKRLESRNIITNVTEYHLKDDIDFNNTDIIFIGGGSDREQKLVCERLCESRSNIISYANDGGTIIAVCGGYQLLGNYYKTENETISGIGLLNIYTEQENDRLIGNIILESSIINSTIVGFENHGGRTYTDNYTPLGKPLYGNGNMDKSDNEGVVYKNVFATYLHGPLLPKNPLLADEIIRRTLDKKYGITELAPLDDKLENAAHQYILDKFLK